MRAAGLFCDARGSRDLVEPLLELGIERPLRMILEQVLGCPPSFVCVARFRLCLLAVLFAPHLSLSLPPQPGRGVSARLAPDQCHVTRAQQPSCSDYAKAAMRDLGCALLLLPPLSSRLFLCFSAEAIAGARDVV